MNCSKCGSSINPGDKFCKNCGALIIANNQSNFNNTSNQNVNSEGLGIASLVIGIISLILSIFINAFVIPLSIIGLVLGIVNVCKKGHKFSGIILNILAIVLSIVILVSIIFFFSSNVDNIIDILNDNFNELKEVNPISGVYKCRDVDSNFDTDKYLIRLTLNNDDTFIYSPYDDYENNYAKGVYSYVNENKTNKSGDYKYYMVTLTGDSDNFVSNGVSVGKDFDSKMEFGITTVNSKKQGVIMFTNTYNTYYCYEN